MRDWLISKLHRHGVRVRVQGVPRGPRELAAALRLLGELRTLGWQRSFRADYPVDSGGDPCPWMNYAAIAILEGLVGRDTGVFEYGSGASTAWLAARSDHVHAVEHDGTWFERVKDMPGADRADIRHVACAGDELDAPDGDPYVVAPNTVADRRPYDLIIVDGMARRSCLAAAPGFLAPNGIVVLDDTERDTYRAARQRLVDDAGYVELTVPGPKPSVSYIGTTSFFLPAAGHIAPPTGSRADQGPR